jgi:hypothetical protein
MRTSVFALLLGACTNPLYAPEPGTSDPADSTAAASAGAGSDAGTSGSGAADGSGADAPAPNGSIIQLRLGEARMPMAEGDGEEPPPGCLDDTNGGISGVEVPETVSVRIRTLTLLGVDDTPDAVLISETGFDDSQAVELTGETVELNAATIPPGEYDGMSLGLWSMALDVQMRLPDLGEGVWPVTVWFAENGGITPRDVTVDVEGIPHWIDVESASLVSTIPEEAGGDTGGDTGLDAYDSGVSDTGAAAEASNIPAERVRTYDNPDFWDEDPVLISSKQGDMTFGVEGGAETLDLAALTDGAEKPVLMLTFYAVDTMRWWEGPGDGSVKADGIYDPAEDCGLRVDIPGVAAGAGGSLDSQDTMDTGA